MMRRVLGALLVTLGALSLGIGLLAKPYLYDRLAVVPLDQDSVTVSEGENVDVIWAHVVDGEATIDKLTGVRVVSTRTTKGIPGVVEEKEVSGKDAFWQTAVKSQAEVDGQMVDLSYSDAGVSLDRRTGEATNCCGDYATAGDLTDPNKIEPRTYAGQYFKFPFDTKQQDYSWYDTAIKRAEPIRFVQEAQIQGVLVYVFRQSIGPESLEQVDIPGSLFSPTETGNVAADLVYSNTRTLWVEPVTGVVIDGNEEISLTYEAPGFEPVHRTVGSIGFNDETVAQNAEEFGQKASLLAFINNWLTLVGVFAGVLLAGLGGYLLLSGGRSRSEPERIESAEPSLV